MSKTKATASAAPAPASAKELAKRVGVDLNDSGFCATEELTPVETSKEGVYVCGAFWSAPATGTDSKAGTLVHEMCHHFDYELYRLPETFHTEGFYKRESTLVAALLAQEAERAGVQPQLP